MFKFLKYLLVMLMVISAGIIVVGYVTGFSDSTLSLIINWALLLLVATALVAIIMPIFYSSGKGGKSTVIKLGIMALLCVVSYVFASDAIPEGLNVQTLPTASTMKWTDAGIILTTILLVVAFLSIIGGALINVIRNR